MKENELKTVGAFYSRTSAQLAQGRLRNNDIESAIFGGDSSYPSLTFTDQVLLKVHPEDYEEAKTILAASESAE